MPYNWETTQPGMGGVTRGKAVIRQDVQGKWKTEREQRPSYVRSVSSLQELSRGGMRRAPR